jgi:hypothetical protein
MLTEVSFREREVIEANCPTGCIHDMEVYGNKIYHPTS